MKKFKKYVEEYEENYQKAIMSKRNHSAGEKKDFIKKVYGKNRSTINFDNSRAKDIMVTIHSKTLAGKEEPVPHNHNFFEMVYVYCGELIHEIDGERITQKENTFILLNPMAFHRLYTKSENDIVFNIIFKEETVLRIFMQLLSKDNQFMCFFSDSIFGINKTKNYIYAELTETLFIIIREIITEWIDKNPMFQQIILADILKLFAEIARVFYQEHTALLDFNQNTDIETILTYIKLHYASTSIPEIANKFNYSPGYVSRLLKQETGMSFTQIIGDLKLRNACNYLQQTSLTMDSIASIIGYNDSSYFYKVFKKNMGISPVQYRQLHDMEI